MLQVKIIRAQSAQIEGEINAFLRQIGSVPYTKVSVQDIKYNVSELQHGNDVAMIIYNQVRIPGPPKSPQTTKP